jgi:hypothetical protein
MQTKRIAGWVLLSAILSAGMTLGCGTTDETSGDGSGGSGGSGGGTGPCDAKPPNYGVSDVHLCLGYVPAPVYRTECPPDTTIITGTIKDVPYSLTAASEIFLIEVEDGFVDITFPSDVANDDFIFLDTTEAFARDALVPVRGMLKLPNTTERYPVLRASRVVVGPRFEHFDFHIVLAHGNLQGCFDGLHGQP